MGKSFEKDTTTGKCSHVRTSSEKKQNRRKVVKFFADSGDSRAIGKGTMSGH